MIVAEQEGIESVPALSTDNLEGLGSRAIAARLNGLGKI